VYYIPPAAGKPAKLNFCSQVSSFFQTIGADFDAFAIGQAGQLKIGIFSFSGRGVIFRRPHSVAPLASHY
jgi:hypothetical protein